MRQLADRGLSRKTVQASTNRLAFSEHGKIGFEEEVDSEFVKANGGVASNPSLDTDRECFSF